MKALVVNCSRNGLGVIRSLGKMGTQIIAADHKTLSPGLYSKYVLQRHLIPTPAENEEAFIQAILELGKKYSSPQESLFLVPVNDEYVLSLSRNWDQIKDYFTPVFETNLEVLEQCVIKDQTYKLALECGVPVPKTRINPNPNEVTESGQFPFIVKPDSKRSPENIKKNVFKLRMCHTIDQLGDAISYLRDLDVSAIVQEYIPGGDDQLYTAGIFSWKGNLVSGFTGRKVRQFPPSAGEASFAELVDEPQILEYSKMLMKESGFTGIAQVEFKKHNNTFYLIEINPRSWSWNSLSDFSGVNLPWSACKTLEEGKPYPLFQSRKKGSWSYFYKDFWFNGLKERNTSILHLIKDCVSASHHAFWKWNDPKPALIEFLHTLALAWGFIKRKITGKKKIKRIS